MTILRHVDTLLSQMNRIEIYKKILNISSMEESKRSNVFNLRYINQVRIQTPYASSITYIQDDIAIYDFDRAMVNVSIGLFQDLMVDRLMCNIRVSMTKRDIQQLQMKDTTW